MAEGCEGVIWFFKWDDSKDILNQEKHGISFVESISVFDDPDALSLYDVSHSDKEDRWITMGLSIKADKKEEISYYNKVR